MFSKGRLGSAGLSGSKNLAGSSLGDWGHAAGVWRELFSFCTRLKHCGLFDFVRVEKHRLAQSGEEILVGLSL